jgi:predicted  nucleic acid-binding Zn-ribbon protein
MAQRKQHTKKIDTVEKLAELLVESVEDLRSDMDGRFDRLGDRMSAVEERLTAVESKIAGLHRRIDNELDIRKQHDVRLTRIEKQLGFAQLK